MPSAGIRSVGVVNRLAPRAVLSAGPKSTAVRSLGAIEGVRRDVFSPRHNTSALYVPIPRRVGLRAERVGQT